MTDICMLFQGSNAHPAHQSFADAVNADYRHFETAMPQSADTYNTNNIISRVKTGGTLSDYDIVIAEGTAPLQTALIYKILHPSTSIIYLSADETFYTLPQRPTRYLWKALRPVTSRLLDGVVAVGEDVYQWGKPYIGSVPVEFVHPPITDEKYERLGALNPDSPQNDFVILSAGMAKYSNGYENLVPAIERLAEYYDNVRLVLLGGGHSSQPYAESPVVTTPGFVDLDEFTEWFERASLYVQSSVGDSFPVAALEGILSGTPTLVTNAVGVRELLPNRQIVEPTIAGLYRGTKRFYQMNPDDRRALGADQRNIVTSITETNQKRRFREAIEKLT